MCKNFVATLVGTGNTSFGSQQVLLGGRGPKKIAIEQLAKEGFQVENIKRYRPKPGDIPPPHLKQIIKRIINLRI